MKEYPVLVQDLKLGEKKRTSGAVARRIWLENSHLREAGFVPGQRFELSLSPEDHTLTVRANARGDRVVSQRERRGRIVPIIDICRIDLAEALPGERIRVEVFPNLIRIRVHPSERARKARIESLQKALEAQEPLRIGDVAHGGGILADAILTGLQRQGVDASLRFAIEIDEPTLQASIRNNPRWTNDTIAFCGDMQEVDLTQIPEVHGLIAGLPCVGASRSGKAKNAIRHAEEHPTAGALFVRFLQIVETANPAFIVLENVPDYQQTVSMVVIRQVLKRLGYRLQETVVDNRLGAFEQRHRMCMVAITEGIDFDIGGLEPSRERETCLGEMLDELPDDDPRWKSYDYLFQKQERDKAAGKGFRMQIRRPEDTEIGTIGAGYAKVRSTEPLIRHPRKPDLYRLLTPAEHARVKSVPPHLVEGLNDTLAHHILGNGVLHAAFVSVGAMIAKAIRRWLGVADRWQDSPTAAPCQPGTQSAAAPNVSAVGEMAQTAFCF